MIAHATFELQATSRSSAIATDALTRIPSGHFVDMAWAKQNIDVCLAIVDDVIRGQNDRPATWVEQTLAEANTESLLAVMSAVCDATIADAFYRKRDVQRITRSVSKFELAAYTTFSAHRERKDVTAMNDSDTAELTAGLVRVVQMHDKDTAVHLDATGALGRRIALAMALPSDQVLTIELAARLHDIGKVAVSKDILCKPGPLTPEEWQEMRSHAEIGASVLLDTPKLAHLAPIVRAHHERMDGYGYPDRLRGLEIPLEARVIGVADAFHAMTTERSYRRAMLPSEALETLADHAGTQFDVDVVDATFELFRYSRRSRRIA